MLDIKFIRTNTEAVRKALIDKGISLDLDELIHIDSKIQELNAELQTTNAEINRLSKKVKEAQADAKAKYIDASREVGIKSRSLKAALEPLEKKFLDLMYRTPTIPADDVPFGESDIDNIVVEEVGIPREFDFEPLDHYDLIEKNNWADFKRISNVSGSRSVAIKGRLLRYEIALWQYTLDKLESKGFTPISVPILVKEQPMYNMGQFPFDHDSVYYLPKDDLYLAGTSEAVINSLHSGEIIKEKDLPILYAGFSPCLRREAGAGGKDTRGVFRVHQFNKVEQFVICKGNLETSIGMYELLINNTREILSDLELPFRIVECCTGDMGAGKYKMHDIETWCPKEKRYRETHSCSNLLDWQARRTNIRYRDETTSKVEYVHTLNNTGIATPRIFVALLENHQQEDGRVRIPIAIRPYMGNAEFL